MVRRRSTVRFRNGAPGRRHNPDHHDVPVGTNGLPRGKISTVPGGKKGSCRTAPARPSRRRRRGATMYRVTPADHRVPGPEPGDPIPVDAVHVGTRGPFCGICGVRRTPWFPVLAQAGLDCFAVLLVVTRRSTAASARQTGWRSVTARTSEARANPPFWRRFHAAGMPSEPHPNGRYEYRVSGLVAAVGGAGLAGAVMRLQCGAWRAARCPRGRPAAGSPAARRCCGPHRPRPRRPGRRRGG